MLKDVQEWINLWVVSEYCNIFFIESIVHTNSVVSVVIDAV